LFARFSATSGRSDFSLALILLGGLGALNRMARLHPRLYTTEQRSDLFEARARKRTFDIAVSMSAVQLHKIKKPACSGGLLFYEFGG
jgi:hypothetical protein